MQLNMIVLKSQHATFMSIIYILLSFLSAFINVVSVEGALIIFKKKQVEH